MNGAALGGNQEKKHEKTNRSLLTHEKELLFQTGRVARGIYTGKMLDKIFLKQLQSLIKKIGGSLRKA